MEYKELSDRRAKSGYADEKQRLLDVWYEREGLARIAEAEMVRTHDVLQAANLRKAVERFRADADEAVARLYEITHPLPANWYVENTEYLA